MRACFDGPRLRTGQHRSVVARTTFTGVGLGSRQPTRWAFDVAQTRLGFFRLDVSENGVQVVVEPGCEPVSHCPQFLQHGVSVHRHSPPGRRVLRECTAPGAPRRIDGRPTRSAAGPRRSQCGGSSRSREARTPCTVAMATCVARRPFRNRRRIDQPPRQLPSLHGGCERCQQCERGKTSARRLEISGFLSNQLGDQQFEPRGRRFPPVASIPLPAGGHDVGVLRR